MAHQRTSQPRRLQTRFQDKLRAVSTRLAITDNVPQSASLDIVRTRSVLVNLVRFTKRADWR